MPTSNKEASQELDHLRQDRDLSFAWIARRIDRNLMWVSRKLRGNVPITFDDYELLRSAIESVAPSKALAE